MPGAAFADGGSSVACTDGTKNGECDTNPTKWTWSDPLTSSSGAATITKVKLDGNQYPVVDGDAMADHPDGVPCVVEAVDHDPPLVEFSSKVTFEGSGAGRIGDKYDDENGFDHIISTGSSKVNIGG